MDEPRENVGKQVKCSRDYGSKVERSPNASYTLSESDRLHKYEEVRGRLVEEDVRFSSRNPAVIAWFLRFIVSSVWRNSTKIITHGAVDK